MINYKVNFFPIYDKHGVTILRPQEVTKATPWGLEAI